MVVMRKFLEGVLSMDNEFNIIDSTTLKGIAILFMVGLHLFNTLDYETLYKPLIYIGKYPLIYYLSFIFDSCVPIYCFCSGYALFLKESTSFKDNAQRAFRFLKKYWLILILTMFTGILFQNKNIPGGFLEFLCNFFLINISYVGAWWFVQTYVLLLVLTPWIIKLVNKNEKLFFCLSLIIYFIGNFIKLSCKIKKHDLS